MSYWKPPTSYSKPLSPTRAAACEAAARKTCICRCGGELHGKSHAKFIAASAEIMGKSRDGKMSREAHVVLAKKLAKAESPKDRKNRLRREKRTKK